MISDFIAGIALISSYFTDRLNIKVSKYYKIFIERALTIY